MAHERTRPDTGRVSRLLDEGDRRSIQFSVQRTSAVVPVAGVTLVSVLPTHRRRGILRSMMRRRLSDIAERGESLAALWASESMLYGRYRYGKASWHATFTVRRGEGTLLPGAPRDPSLTLRLVEPGEARPDLEKVFETALRSRPGLLARNEDWWDARLYDPEPDRAAVRRCAACLPRTRDPQAHPRPRRRRDDRALHAPRADRVQRGGQRRGEAGEGSKR